MSTHHFRVIHSQLKIYFNQVFWSFSWWNRFFFWD